MSGIRELSFDEIALVSGGNANGQDAGERSNYGTSNLSSRSRRGGVPVTTANNVGFVIIGGVLTAIAGAINPVVGVGVGITFAALDKGMPSPSGNGSSNSGGGWHDTNPGGMVGECRW